MLAKFSDTTVSELVRMAEKCFGLEDRNRADTTIPEILERFDVKSLGDVTEAQLETFRYMANIHVDSKFYKLLLFRRFVSKAGISWPEHYNF